MLHVGSIAGLKPQGHSCRYLQADSNVLLLYQKSSHVMGGPVGHCLCHSHGPENAYEIVPSGEVAATAEHRIPIPEHPSEDI